MLEQFFSGVLATLQAEVDLINSLVPHNATKGSLNEHSLHRILTSFLPGRYSLGSGFVIDSFGNTSRQADLIIYDAEHASPLFRAYSQVIYPVETVFGCIEVKTCTSRNALAEIAEENIALETLRHYCPTIRTVTANQEASALSFRQSDTRPPLTSLVSYHTETRNPLTVRNWFLECPNRQTLPDASLFLDIGMVVVRPRPTEKETFDFLLMPMRGNEGGVEAKDVLYEDEPDTPVVIGGRQYRSSMWRGKVGHPIIMPERALLNFLVQLVRALDAFPKHATFDPSFYLAQYSDEGLDIEPDA